MVQLTSGDVVGHTEDGESIGAFDMENVAILRVRDVGIVVPGDLVQYLPRNRTGVRRRRAVLRQHH